VEHLEAAVQPPPVDHVGRYPAADPVGRLDQEPVDAGAGQPAGSREPAPAAPGPRIRSAASTRSQSTPARSSLRAAASPARPPPTMTTSTSTGCDTGTPHTGDKQRRPQRNRGPRAKQGEGK